MKRVYFVDNIVEQCLQATEDLLVRPDVSSSGQSEQPLCTQHSEADC